MVLYSKTSFKMYDFPSEEMLCLMSLNHVKFHLCMMKTFYSLYFCQDENQANAVLIEGGLLYAAILLRSAPMSYRFFPSVLL